MHRIITSTTPANGNFADLVLRHAQLQPWVTALYDEEGSGRTLSFAQLADEVTTLRALIRAQSWPRQARVVLMLAPSPFLYVCVLALLAEGMVPVFIDRGLGRKRMLQALAISGARQVISEPAALRMGRLLTLNKGISWWSEATLRASNTHLDARVVERTHGLTIRAGEHGLISYTSGTTGRPKGADRTHQSLIAQHQAIRANWQDQPGDIDMTCLPVLVLHNLCCGMPSVLPAMDFAAPARAPGKLIAAQIARYGVTRLSGAPAFISRVADAATDNTEARKQLRHVRSIRVGGAPVGSKLAKSYLASFESANIAVVYGSTEAEPIAHCDARALADDKGVGYPVGQVVNQTRHVRVACHEHFADELALFAAEVAADEPGEIIVKGPHVLQGYVNDAAATRENKILAEDGVWHRTGDIAITDACGQLRLLGRRSDQLHWQQQRVHPFAVERQLQDLPHIRQAALVQAEKNATPCLFVSLEADADERASIQSCRLALKGSGLGSGLASIPVRVLPELPVDSRHNCKIQRQLLRKRCA